MFSKLHFTAPLETVLTIPVDKITNSKKQLKIEN